MTMLSSKMKLLAVVALAGGAAFIAGCDDSTGTGGAGGTGTSSSSTKATTGTTMTTTTGTGSSMTTSSTGGALCPVTGTVDTCDNACSTLYDCAALSMCNGKDLCAGVDGTPAQKTAFIGTANGNCSVTKATTCMADTDCPAGEKCGGGCLYSCGKMMALKSLVDPTDCEGTVSQLSTINPGFKGFCDTGM
jgi:hypothetical protein